MNIWGIRVSFGCERSCSSPRRVSNWQRTSGGIYHHIKSYIRVRALTSSGSAWRRCGGGDAKTTTSPNTSIGDIIIFAWDSW